MADKTSKQNKPSIERIVGEQLSAVVFVQDYLQLQFDGPCLTLLTWPIVKTGGGRFEYGMPKYRDVLCECIAKIVTQAQIKESEEISIQFDNGSALLISLRPEHNSSAETAILTNNPEEIWVW